VGTLSVWVWHETFADQRRKRLLVLALSFSLVGDVFLMIPGSTQSLFQGGLISFLIAHLLYIRLFLIGLIPERIKSKLFVSSLILSAFFGLSLFALIGNSLGNLLVPVICYMVIILSMALVAINRKSQVTPSSYFLCLTGAILFVMSDSILAINKFYVSLPAAGFFIMSSYSFAQYFIAKGIIAEQTRLHPVADEKS
jgi:uncharacterized membrane protein YhhN